MITVSREMWFGGLGGGGERKLEHFLFRCGDFSIACLAQRKTNPYFWDVDACLEKERGCSLGIRARDMGSVGHI